MITRGWTAEQDKKLIKYCNLKTFTSVSVMSKDIGKSERTIYTRMAFLGLERPSYTWTKEQDDMLRELYPSYKISVKDIAIKLNRTERAVLGRATKLKLYRFDNYDLKKYIINNYGKDGISAIDIANKFDRPLKTVYRMALRLGMTRKQEFGQMTTSQATKIIERYATENTYKLSADIGVPDYTIRKLASKNGIKKAPVQRNKSKKTRKTHKWTLEQEQFIIDNHENMTMMDIASELGLRYNMIRGKISTMGLSNKNLKIYNVGNIRFKYNTEEEKKKKIDYITMVRNLITESRIGDVCR